MSQFYASYPVFGSGGVAVYSTIGAFPAGTAVGQLAVAADTGILYEWNGTSWVAIAGPGAVFSIGTYDSGSPSANGLHITGDALIAQSASATVPGMVNTGVQTFAGNKTFTGTIGASNLSGTNTGDVTIGTANGLSLAGQGLSLALSSTSTTGALSSTDWNTFNNKGSGSVTSVAQTVPAFLSITGSPITTSGTLAIGFSGSALPVANGGTGVTSLGNLTDAGTDGIVITGGTGAVITSASIAQHVADTTHNGYLSSTDWNAFNGKQAAGNYITALTGDVTATGPGSVAATLATVNGNVGSFGSSTSIPSFTVNGKGLITAASGNVVIAPAGTLTGTTLNATVVSSSLTSVGTLTTGTWNATTIAVAHGGTSNTTLITSPTASTIPAWDANSNLSANMFIPNYGQFSANGVAKNITAATSYFIDFSAGTTNTQVNLPTTPSTQLTYFITNSTTATITVKGDGGNTLQAMAPNTSLYVYYSGQGTTGWYWTYDNLDGALPGSGTVTSVALTVPAFLSVAGSPITTSGTLAVTFSGTALPVANGGTGQTSLTAHDVLVGNGTGAVTLVVPTATTGVALVSNGTGSDPSFSAVNIASGTAVTGTLATANGGTGQASNWNADGVIYASSTTVLASTTAGTSGQVLTSNGAGVAPTMQTVAGNTAILKAPTVQRFTSGSGTYTTPTSPGPLYLKVTMCAGGAGGSGSGVTPGAGASGGNTTFGSSLLTATGGTAPGSETGPGQGGGTTVNSPAIAVVSLTGGDGSGAIGVTAGVAPNAPGGGSNPFGGAGGGVQASTAGASAKNNTGGGGGGSTGSSGISASGSGGAGGYIVAIITAPSATYAYAVGAGGAGGTLGTGGTAGGSGGSGVVIVEEYYQ